MQHAQSFEFTDALQVSRDDYVAEVPAGLTSAQSLLQALYKALELPGYFGFNWDALSDSLRDLHWLKQRRIILRHADVPAIPSGDLRTYVEVLAEAQKSWAADEDHSLCVIFPFAARSEVTPLM